MVYSAAARIVSFTNSTDAASFQSILVDVLERFIPGYSVLSEFFLAAFGFDISVVVSFALLLFALVSSVRYLTAISYSLIFVHFTSSIVIDDDDGLFYDILRWLAAQPAVKVSRSLKAVTPYGTLESLESISDELKRVELHGECSDKDLFSLGKRSSRRKPRYEPNAGQHRLWQDGTLFFFLRSRVSERDRRLDEQIEITCLGRSTKPIKDLMERIESWSIEREQALTVIYRPEPKEEDSPCTGWDRICERPSRPIDSVVLDQAQKTELLEDMKDFLRPLSRFWYSNCGVPYRRGYLFHGPPGCGKTSLSTALAGLFGLDIYVASLMDRTLTEQDLIRLLSDLPNRCIVLLEDVDSAGLRRSEQSETESTEDTEVESLKVIAQTLKERDGTSKQGFSLSGLLNAIDGVASHEGHILILTTNHPEKLDPALLRPGRVDLRIEFSLASRAQIRELFIRIYSSGQGIWLKNKSGTTSGTAEKVSITNGHTGDNPLTRENEKSQSDLPIILADGRELTAVADEFASRLPENTLTPAEVQGYLFMHKKDPLQALALMSDWIHPKLGSKRIAQRSSYVELSDST